MNERINFAVRKRAGNLELPIICVSLRIVPILSEDSIQSKDDKIYDCVRYCLLLEVWLSSGALVRHSTRTSIVEGSAGCKTRIASSIVVPVVKISSINRHLSKMDPCSSSNLGD